MVKLPSPKIVDEKFYQLQGLYADQDAKGWETTWRNFRASLFHLSLHAAFSDFRGYAPWAKGKDVGAATFAVSLVEDVHIITEARSKWAGVLADLAYASYLSALRLADPDEIDNSPLRVATKLLLSSAGVFRTERVEALARRGRGGRRRRRARQDRRGGVREGQVSGEARPSSQRRPRRSTRRSAPGGSSPRYPTSLSPRPTAHATFSTASSSSTTRPRETRCSGRPSQGWASSDDTTATDAIFLSEAQEVLASTEISNARLAKIRAYYEGLIAPTRLDSVEIPPGDYGSLPCA